MAIRRTTKDDILRRGVIEHFGKKRGGLSSVPQPENPDAMTIDGHEVNLSELCLDNFFFLYFHIGRTNLERGAIRFQEIRCVVV